MLKSYYLIHLGKGNKFAKDGLDGGYIGLNFLDNIDLSKDSTLDYKDFKTKYVPVLMKREPERNKVSAGLAIGNTWVVTNGMKAGDIVLMPLGDRTYQVGEILDGYHYEPSDSSKGVSHRRNVKWIANFSRDEMSDSFKNSSGSIMTVINVSDYAAEIEKLIGGKTEFDTSEIENIADFGLEKHLEEFLIYNWDKTILGKEYEIYSEDGKKVGQQYQTEVGIIDILALSKDKKTWLIVELKKGHSSDKVAGQIARYLGYANQNIIEKGQSVKGLIISGSDDKNIRYAITSLKNVEFMTYEVSFKLNKEIANIK